MLEKTFRSAPSDHSGDLSATGKLSAASPPFRLLASSSDAHAKPRPSRAEPTRLRTIPVPGVPQAIVDRIAESEGVRRDVYRDSTGHPTVGIGHLLNASEKKKWRIGDVLSLAEITALAKQDIGTAWKGAKAQAAKLGISNFAFKVALFEVNFQLGTTWYSVHKKTWTHMRHRRWEQAAAEAARSKWNRQTPKRVANFQRALRKLSGHKTESTGGFDLWDQLSTTAKQPHSTDKPSPPFLISGKAEIKQAQGRLKVLGLYDGAIDGYQFRRDGRESDTTKAIKAFQAKVGIAVDGHLNGTTFARLIGGGKIQSRPLFDRPMSQLVAEAKGGKATPQRKPQIFAALGDLRDKVRKGESLDPENNRLPDVAPILDESQFFSQFNGASSVPLSFLKANMSAKKTEEDYRQNGCLQSCRYMLMQAGFTPQDVSTSKYMVEVSFKKKDGFKKWLSGVASQAEAGKSRLDQLLTEGKPVIVGVNRSNKNARWTNYKPDGSLSPTDHFVVIVARQTMEDGTVAYRYFDPGRSHVDNGASADNLLFQQNEYIAAEGHKSRYTVSEVRNTKKEGLI